MKHLTMLNKVLATVGNCIALAALSTPTVLASNILC